VLVERDSEAVKEPVLPQYPGNVNRQLGEADHRLVADHANSDRQPPVSCNLLVTGRSAEGVGWCIAEPESEHRRHLHVEDGVVGTRVDKDKEPGGLATNCEGNGYQRTMVVRYLRESLRRSRRDSDVAEALRRS